MVKFFYCFVIILHLVDDNLRAANVLRRLGLPQMGVILLETVLLLEHHGGVGLGECVETDPLLAPSVLQGKHWNIGTKTSPSILHIPLRTARKHLRNLLIKSRKSGKQLWETNGVVASRRLLEIAGGPTVAHDRHLLPSYSIYTNTCKQETVCPTISGKLEDIKVENFFLPTQDKGK